MYLAVGRLRHGIKNSLRDVVGFQALEAAVGSLARFGVAVEYLGEFGFDKAWADGCDADGALASTQFLAKSFGQSAHGVLAGRVHAAATRNAMGCH